MKIIAQKSAYLGAFGCPVNDIHPVVCLAHRYESNLEMSIWVLFCSKDEDARSRHPVLIQASNYRQHCNLVRSGNDKKIKVASKKSFRDINPCTTSGLN